MPDQHDRTADRTDGRRDGGCILNRPLQWIIGLDYLITLGAQPIRDGTQSELSLIDPCTSTIVGLAAPAALVLAVFAAESVLSALHPAVAITAIVAPRPKLGAVPASAR